MDTNSAVKQMIHIIEHARQQIKEIENLPGGFGLRADRAMEILSNSASHAIGQSFTPSSHDVPYDPPPITNFMGREIVPAKKLELEIIDPSSKSLEIFRAECNKIIDVMETMSQKQFFDNYNESEIRGVGKLLGLPITGTEPEMITMELIGEIYKAKTHRNEITDVKTVSADALAETKKDDEKTTDVKPFATVNNNGGTGYVKPDETNSKLADPKPNVEPKTAATNTRGSYKKRN